MYKCQCLTCGYTTDKFASNIKKRNCAVCTNKIIVAGYNDILTTHPHLKNVIVDIDFAKTISFGSHHKIKVRCLDCGEETFVTPSNLIKWGVPCKKCGDGISYPNKFIYNFLQQLNIEFECEKIFEWSKPHRYDIYIPQYNLIIENQGKQHYSKHGFVSLGGKTLTQQIDIDKYKKDNAMLNGIENYIELDCKYSEANYIKNSILNSNLLQILNAKIEDVDLKLCDFYACKNIVKEVCTYYMNYNATPKQMTEIFPLSNVTISSYLKRGNDLGWCKYDAKDNMRINGAKNGRKRSKKIVMLDTNEIYDSAVELSKCSLQKYGVFLNQSGIREVCRGIKNKYKGYSFKYYDD